MVDKQYDTARTDYYCYKEEQPTTRTLFPFLKQSVNRSAPFRLSFPRRWCRPPQIATNGGGHKQGTHRSLLLLMFPMLSYCFLEGERPKTSNRPKWVSEPNLVENLYQVSRARFGYYIRRVAFWEKSIPSNLDQLHKSFSRPHSWVRYIGTLHPTHPNVRHTLESPAISTHSSTEAFSRESLVEICLRSVLCRPTENGTHMPLVKTKESRGRSPKSFFCWQAHVPNLVEDHSCEGCNAPISPSETWRA